MKKILIIFISLFLLTACDKTGEIPEEKEKYEVYTLYIYTEDSKPITSKEDYINGFVEVKGGKYACEPLEMEIRGRGNSTWMFEKKPYRIKMKERYSLLGMKEIKNYVLLAEYSDKSLLRNYIAHKLSSYLNTYYVLETRHIELYLNDEYQGVYLLTEQIKNDKKGLVVNDYLLELEQDKARREGEGLENKHWFTSGKTSFVIKEPDMDDIKDAAEIAQKIDYLKGFIGELTNSLSTDEYDTYIDVDNFIDYFVLHEIFKNVDIGYSSVFSVIKDNKLYMGPNWDFDISLGNGDYFNSSYKLYRNRYNPWFDTAIDNQAFKERYLMRLLEVLEDIMPKLIEDLDYAYDGLKESAERNFDKWDILGTYTWPNPEAMWTINTYEGQYRYIREYLVKRTEWLKNEIKTKGYYDYKPE
ncbi:MAG: CotH kinase family protein [Acholeplasmatales bacterium]